jgi:hypothetical protein
MCATNSELRKWLENDHIEPFTQNKKLKRTHLRAAKVNTKNKLTLLAPYAAYTSPISKCINIAYETSFNRPLIESSFNHNLLI